MISGIDEVKKIDVLDRNHIAVVTTDGKLITNFERQPVTEVTEEMIAKGYADAEVGSHTFEQVSSEV